MLLLMNDDAILSRPAHFFPWALSSRQIAAAGEKKNGGVTQRRKIIDHQRKVPKLNFLFFSFWIHLKRLQSIGDESKSFFFLTPTHTQSRTQVILQDRKNTSHRRRCASSIRTGHSLRPFLFDIQRNFVSSAWTSWKKREFHAKKWLKNFVNSMDRCSAKSQINKLVRGRNLISEKL